jgi:nucleoside-diphosphate-sugar epimerase
LVSRSERVLLTGSGGFTGRPLAARLRQDGHEVFGITKGPATSDEIQGDLLNRDWVHGTVEALRPTVVVHLAAVSPTQQTGRDAYMVNVDGAANLLAAASALRERPRRAILASSAAVYAPPIEGRPIAEDHPLAPRGPYAESKRAMEDVASTFADRLSILVVRPFNYTGPGQDPANFLVPELVEHFVRRAPRIHLGNLDLFRDFSDIRRVVEVYARLISRPVDDHIVVNICSGRTIHLASIIGLLQEMSGHSVEIVTDTALVRPGEPRTIRGSAERLQSMVGDLPNPDFRETLRSMYEGQR